jgi:hypothetical protein
MSQNITLELRQLDSTAILANGDFETILANEIILNDSDVMNLKSCMLDTVAETSAIILEDDITIVTATCPFFTDVQDFSSNIEKNQFTTGEPSDYKQTLLSYAPMKKIVNGTVSGLVSCSGWNYLITVLPSSEPSKSSYATNYSYINEFGVLSYAHGLVEKVPDDGQQYSRTDTFSTIIAQAGTIIRMGDPDIPYAWRIEWADTPNTTGVTNTIYKPYAIPFEFVIPKGSYSPTEMAQLVTEKMTTNGGGSAKSMIQSAYLWSVNSFEVGYNQPDGTRNPDGSPQVIAEPVIFCDPGLNYAITFNTGVRQWTGTSQVSLEYDSDSQRFSWVYTHFPLYSSDGKDISMKFARFNQDLTQPIQQVLLYGGIFFTTLTALDVNGNFFDFFGGKLGLNVGAMMSNVTVKGPLNNVIFGKQGTFYQYELVPGLTHTTGFGGIDAAVIKNVGANANWWEESPMDVGTDVQYATVNATIPIRGELTMPQLLNTFSHYILQLDLYFSKVVGKDVQKNIHGLITKYYSAGGFCFGDSSEGLEYIHRGAPMVIRSIKARILRPDRTLDPLLGPDNTIYLQVIRNTPNLVKTIN